MKSSIITISLSLLSFVLTAQYAEDALRYSELYYQGTARNMALGNTMEGVGGDFSVLSTNPGGLGVFRNSEAVFTPEISARRVNSIYNGTATEDNKTIFDISSFGMVMTKKLGREAKGWKYVNYAFGMNRLNNYNSNILMQGMNMDNSRIDVYLDETAAYLNDGGSLADINTFDPFYLGPAWNTYLIDTITIDGQLYLDSPVPQGGILQTQYIQTEGSNNEWLAAIGGNFNDRLYIGATLGLPYIRFSSETNYTETDALNDYPNFNSWSVSEYLTTTGWGVNFKIGALVRPIDWLRIGLAYHTPTYYWSMRDNWWTLTTGDVYAISDQQWHNEQSVSPTGDYSYKLTTPMRFIADLGIVIKEVGFIAAAYEYADYGQAKFKSEYQDYSFSDVNSEIKSTYQGTNNFRMGTEWRYSIFSFRAGYSLYASPYSNNLNDGKRQSYSGGVGLKYNAYSFDFAYVYSKMDEDYYLYSTSNYQTNPVTNSIVSQNFVLSFRYKF